MRRLLDFHRGSISKAVYQLFLGGLEARICTGIGRPVPLPPHELHRIIPDPSHVLHPTSSSDHLVHMQGTRRDPLHVGHWLNPLMGFSCSASIIDFIIHAPARQLMPCATWVITPGDILQSAQRLDPSRRCRNQFRRASSKQGYLKSTIREISLSLFATKNRRCYRPSKNSYEVQLNRVDDEYAEWESTCTSSASFDWDRQKEQDTTVSSIQNFILETSPQLTRVLKKFMRGPWVMTKRAGHAKTPPQIAPRTRSKRLQNARSNSPKTPSASTKTTQTN